MPEDVLRHERAKPLRSPLMIVVAAAIVAGHKIPVVEQLLAAGAATQNIMLAAHAMGYGAMWRTGDGAYDDTVKKALGLKASDAIVGFLYLGTAAGRTPIPPDEPAVTSSFIPRVVRPRSLVGAAALLAAIGFTLSAALAAPVVPQGRWVVVPFEVILVLFQKTDSLKHDGVYDFEPVHFQSASTALIAVASGGISRSRD